MKGEANKLFIIYDERMCRHRPSSKHDVETPKRIREIVARLEQKDLLRRLVFLLSQSSDIILCVCQSAVEVNLDFAWQMCSSIQICIYQQLGSPTEPVQPQYSDRAKVHIKLQKYRGMPLFTRFSFVIWTAIKHQFTEQQFCMQMPLLIVIVPFYQITRVVRPIYGKGQFSHHSL